MPIRPPAGSAAPKGAATDNLLPRSQGRAAWRIRHANGRHRDKTVKGPLTSETDGSWVNRRFRAALDRTIAQATLMIGSDHWVAARMRVSFFGAPGDADRNAAGDRTI